MLAALLVPIMSEVAEPEPPGPSPLLVITPIAPDGLSLDPILTAEVDSLTLEVA